MIACRIWVEHVCVAALREFEQAVMDLSGHATMMALTVMYSLFYRKYRTDW